MADEKRENFLPPPDFVFGLAHIATSLRCFADQAGKLMSNAGLFVVV